MSALLELAARVEAATGPSRELDEAIALALGWAPVPNPTHAGGAVGRWTKPDGSSTGHEGPPYWSASLDAAMRLADEEWETAVLWNRDKREAWAAVGPNAVAGYPLAEAKAKGLNAADTQARAFTAACLRAALRSRAAMSPTTGEGE